MSTAEAVSPTEGVLRKATEVQKVEVIEWEINNFLDLPQQKDWKLSSPIFVFSDVEWFLRIYPYGNSCDDSVSLYLRKKTSLCVIPITFTLGIKKPDGSIFISEDFVKIYSKEESSQGSQVMIKRSALLNSINEIAPRNILTVFCTFPIKKRVAVVDEASQTPSMCGLEKLSKHFRESFISGTHSDIKINVKGKEFSAHKMILSARSSVFQSMLELDMKEKNENFININDCDPDSFGDFLHFLYGGKLDIVSPSNALNLYFTSDKYNVEELKEQCAICLAESVSVDSVCDVILLATVHDEMDLLDTATEFFIENANIVIKTPKWLSFMAGNLTLANELLIKMTDKYKKG